MRNRLSKADRKARTGLQPPASGGPPCVICGEAAQEFGSKRGFTLYRCPCCRHVFVWPIPGDHLAVYSDEYFCGGGAGFGYTDYDRDKQPMVPTFLEYLDRLSRLGKSTGRLLDIGSATGFFLELARQRGWQPLGVEPSDYAASVARSKGIDVRTGTLENCTFPLESLDVITMWDVIEHMPDPARCLSLAVPLLKSGGIIAINTPDSSSLLARMLKTKWHLVVPPEHLHLFSRSSLQRLVAAQSLELVELTSIGKTFTLNYVLMTLSHWWKSQLLASAVEKLRNRSVGNWRLAIDLHDNMFLIARKP